MGDAVMLPVQVDPDEIELSAIRSQGPGGQNVNKVSSAIHLRFDIAGSSLPEVYKERLLALHDRRITKDGVIVLKAQQSRSQEQNKVEALLRLQEMVDRIAIMPVLRRRLMQHLAATGGRPCRRGPWAAARRRR